MRRCLDLSWKSGKLLWDSEVKRILGIELSVVQYDELGAEQGGKWIRRNKVSVNTSS